MMIKEAFRNDKHFIVAKLKSRGYDKFEDQIVTDDSEQHLILKKEGEKISNFFNVYSVIKLIVQKKGD